MNDEPRSQSEDPLREIEEREQVVVSHLRAERPFPAPAFRGELLRRLRGARGSERQPGLVGSLGAQIAGCLGAGLVLLAVAAAGLVGAGPFGA